jgi:UDP-MurNAc hydroxylase
MSDTIRWINHAGYELRAGATCIVHDPWLQGLAFSKGWALLSPTAAVSFDDVDYIWISHEHPDHFSPASLKEIAPHDRGRITVLYQQTRDGRVLEFCRKLGFQVQELPDRQRVPLRDGIAITCGRSGGDSWSFLETPEHTYFNANDCVTVPWRKVAGSLTRPVDVLLTQFSYANWVGNPGENSLMALAAVEKIEEMQNQIAALRPKMMVPFASYVWFCREDNFHLNEEANRIDRIFAQFRELLPTVILYPGDIWRVGEDFDSERSVERYLADWRSHGAPLALPDESRNLAEIDALSERQQAALKKKNTLWPLRALAYFGYLAPIGIYLWDLQIGIKYSMFGGVLASGIERGKCDLEISSDSFAAMLANGYGYATLLVNGRLRELTPGALRALGRHFAVAAQNERGNSFPGMLLQLDYLRPRFRAQ